MPRFSFVLALGVVLMSVPDPSSAAVKNAEDARLANLLPESTSTKSSACIRSSPRSRGTTNSTTGSTIFRPKRAKTSRPRETGSPDCRRRSTARNFSRNGQIDLEIWTHALKYGLWSVENDNRFEFDPARLRRIHLRQRVPPVHAIDAAARTERRRTPPSGSRSFPKIVAAAKASLKNPPKILTEIAIKRNLGAIAFYEKEIYEFAEGDARQRAARDAVQGRREGAQGLSDVARKGTAAASRPASGGSARRSSPRSWNWNSTPA